MRQKTMFLLSSPSSKNKNRSKGLSSVPTKAFVRSWNRKKSKEKKKKKKSRRRRKRRRKRGREDVVEENEE
jgi:hypothetical protein